MHLEFRYHFFELNQPFSVRKRLHKTFCKSVAHVCVISKLYNTFAVDKTTLNPYDYKMTTENQPTTMKDIAEKFGVSIATVSRALSGSKRVSEEKRNAICRYAREHDFYPNDIAKSLRNSRRKPIRIIGVIVPEFTHYYFSSVLTGIEEAATERDYRIIVATSRESYEREVAVCQMFEAHQVCGVIVSQAKDTVKYDHFKSLLSKGIPIVFYDRICTGVDASRVVVDDYTGAFMAVQHLIETGCKRIAFYGMAVSTEIGKNRYNGWHDALLKAGIHPDDSFVRLCDNREDAERITPEMLNRTDRPDAFFCVNDDTAIGVIYTANILIDKAEGLIPPQKIEKRVIRTRLVVRGSSR